MNDCSMNQLNATLTHKYETGFGLNLFRWQITASFTLKKINIFQCHESKISRFRCLTKIPKQ